MPGMKMNSGRGYLESVMPDDEETVQDKARIFVNHLF